MLSEKSPFSVSSVYPILILLLSLIILPLSLSAQNQDSRAGDEAALQALYASSNGSGWANNTGWSSSGMSLGDDIYGVTVETIDGELRVTAIDLKNNGLTGNIDVPELANLQQVRLFAVYLNALNSPVPAELTQMSALRYLYLSGSDHTASIDQEYPHEETTHGVAQVHVGKTPGNERNVFTGPIPSGFSNLQNLEWFMLNWTDEWSGGGDQPSVVNGITAIPDDIFDIPSLVFLSIYENWNIAASGNQRPLPSTLSSMTNLEHLYLGGGSGTGWDEDGQGFLTGSWPDMSAHTKMKSLQIHRHGQLSGFPDLSACTNLENFHLPFTDMGGGDMPDWVLDGRFENADTFDFSWPQGEGFTGILPEEMGNMPGMDRVSLAGNNMTGSIPASFWELKGGDPPRKNNFMLNRFTSIGRTDFTSYDGFNHIRVSGNEIRGERWPELNWDNPPPLDHVWFDDNRYVFADMLYIPEGQTETTFELYNSLNTVTFRYSPQKPFGYPDSRSYATGTDIILDDFSTVVTHEDNNYQWQKDGSEISGATDRSLTIANAQSSDGGTYRLVVTNSGVPDLTLTSEPVTIEVSDNGGSNPPDSPALTSPEDGATGISTSPLLDWNASSGAENYQLQLATSSNFSTSVIDNSELSSSQFEASGLTSSTTYYWRVRASNSAGTSDWSSTHDFTTQSESNTTLSAPTLSSPSDGSTDIATSPTFSWNSVSGASTYRLQIATSSDFSSVVTDNSDLTSTSFTAGDLNNSTTYYWRVQASNSEDTSDWSAVRDFTTQASGTSGISSPVLISPGDGTTTTSLQPTWEWEPVEGADYYIFHVSGRNPSEMLIEAEVEEPNYTSLTALDPERTHDWRVRAVIDGEQGEWSPIWRFSTGEGFDYTLTIEGSEGMRMVSTPAANTTLSELLSPLWTQGVSGSDAEQAEPNIFVWSEENQAFELPSSMSDEMVPGRGYILWVFEDDNPDQDGTQGGFPKVLGVNGSENSSPVSVPITVTDANNSTTIDGQEGWNMVGNPYGVPILVDEILSAAREVNSQVNANVYVWDPVASDYIGLPEGEGHTISPFQTFWLRYLAEGEGTLSLEKSLLSASNKTLNKVAGTNTLNKEGARQITFKLKQDSTSRDEFAIQFNEKGKVGIDLYDAYKLSSLTPMSSRSTVQLYSIEGEEDNTQEYFSTSYLPDSLTAPLTLKIGFAKSGDGDATLTWPEFSNLPQEWTIELEDIRQNKSINLRNNDSYTFTSSAGSDNQRFVLHIAPETSAGGPEPSENPQQVTLSQNYPNPFNPSTEIKYSVDQEAEVTLTIYSLIGKKIATLVENRVQNQGTYNVRFDASQLTSGIYIYQLKVGGETLTKKMTLIK